VPPGSDDLGKRATDARIDRTASNPTSRDSPRQASSPNSRKQMSIQEKITLYDKPECPFCWKVRLALAELGLPVERFDSENPVTRENWRRLTPRQTVPVMQVGNQVIYESAVMLEFLEESVGGLMPTASRDRIQARQLNQYSDGVIGPALREIIFEKRAGPEEQWNQERIRQGLECFEHALEYLAAQLGNAEFFAGSYSLPECALSARFGLAQAYGVELPAKFPNLQRWFYRMQSRPSYLATAPARVQALTST
jgi:glutathione S-transferase